MRWTPPPAAAWWWARVAGPSSRTVCPAEGPRIPDGPRFHARRSDGPRGSSSPRASRARSSTWPIRGPVCPRKTAARCSSPSTRPRSRAAARASGSPSSLAQCTRWGAWCGWIGHAREAPPSSCSFRLRTADDPGARDRRRAGAPPVPGLAARRRGVRGGGRGERLRYTIATLRAQLDTTPVARALVAESPAMKQALDLVARVADHKTTVLITGESGTGKEVIAQAIHRASPRAGEAFVAINCAAIPETLLESELFGYVRGAFTGASGDKPGLFEQADRGTLLLDEIGELPLALQAKLLRVLQEGEIRRLGDEKTRRVDARVLAATAKDLAAEVAAGRFREDLFYRLNVVTIHLPTLRERVADIAPLAGHFAARLGRRLGRPVTLSSAALSS